jgi:hypothetical protein
VTTTAVAAHSSAPTRDARWEQAAEERGSELEHDCRGFEPDAIAGVFKAWLHDYT